MSTAIADSRREGSGELQPEAIATKAGLMTKTLLEGEFLDRHENV